MEKAKLSDDAKNYIHPPDHERFIKEDIVDQMLNDQSPKSLKIVRCKFYELGTKGIGVDLIF